MFHSRPKFNQFRRAVGEEGTGRIQIWQPKPLQRISSATENSSSQTASSYTREQLTALSNNKLTEVILASGNASIISSPGGGKALTFSEPEAPVVVIYTLCQKKYTFLHLRRMLRVLIWFS